MNTIEIILFTQYPNLGKIYLASDGAYFVKLKEVQAYSISILNGTFVEILRPANLPPLPSDPIPINEQWVKFPTLWQWKGDFTISGNVQLLPVPALENRMWVYRIVSTTGTQSKELRWGNLEAQKLIVGVGDFVMCTSDGWIKIENALRMKELEVNVSTVIAQATALQQAIIASNNAVLSASQNLTALQVSSGVFSSPVINRFLFGSQSDDGTFAQFSGDVEVKGNISATNGFMYVKHNTVDIPFSGIGGAISCNRSGGNAELNFINTFDVNAASTAFTFSQKVNATTIVDLFTIMRSGFCGIGTNNPTSKLQVVGLLVFANNTAAISAGLTAGAFYRTSTGVLMVVF